MDLAARSDMFAWLKARWVRSFLQEEHQPASKGVDFHQDGLRSQVKKVKSKPKRKTDKGLARKSVMEDVDQELQELQLECEAPSSLHMGSDGGF